MKKLFALVMVCGFAVTIVACGGKKTEETTPAVDSVAVMDSVAAPVDSVAVMDSVAAPVQ